MLFIIERLYHRKISYRPSRLKSNYPNQNGRKSYKVWRVKQSKNCSIDFTTIQTSIDAWNFDSGCSRHMTGNRSLFSELKECAYGHVTFGDGVKGRIIAKGSIVKNNLPYLNDVRYVEGLKANLISVSQLCDQVNFSKENCVVTEENKRALMHGCR